MDNGFSEYRRSIQRMEDQLDRLIRDVSDIKGDIKLLKYKASIWGGLSGGIVITVLAISKKLMAFF